MRDYFVSFHKVTIVGYTIRTESQLSEMSLGLIPQHKWLYITNCLRFSIVLIDFSFYLDRQFVRLVSLKVLLWYFTGEQCLFLTFFEHVLAFAFA
jgi:hypothetical protein